MTASIFDGRWTLESGSGILGSYLVMRLPHAVPGDDAQGDKCPYALDSIVETGLKSISGRWRFRLTHGEFNGEIGDDDKLSLHFPDANASYVYTRALDDQIDRRKELNGTWLKIEGNRDLGSFLTVLLPEFFCAPDAQESSRPWSLRGVVQIGSTVNGFWTHRDAGGVFAGQLEDGKLSLHFPCDGTRYVFERYFGRVSDIPRADCVDAPTLKFVVEAMQAQGWPDIDSSLCKSKLLEGGSPLTEVICEVTCPESSVALPRVVFKRYADIATRNARMFAAATAFSRVGASPTVIAATDNWILEAHGGKAVDFQGDETTARNEFASLIARLHSAPVDWIDAWRTENVAKYPALGAIPVGSALWPVAAYAGPKSFEKFTCTEVQHLVSKLPGPRSAAGKTTVSTHGDLHDGNMLMAPSSELLAVDFEFSCVSNAIQDLMIKVLFSSDPERRALCTAYLQATKQPCTEDEVDLLVFDCFVASIVHFGILRRVFFFEVPIAACGRSIMSMQEALELLDSTKLREAVASFRPVPDFSSRFDDRDGGLWSLGEDIPGFVALLADA